MFANGYYAAHERILGLYRPLGNWSLLLNAALARSLFGGVANPVPYHAVNVLLHAGASLLLLVWLGRLGLARLVAGGCALLWAVHPIHAEVVANVTARYESLAAVLGLSFLVLHRAGRAIPAALCFLAALLSKESAVVFLPIAAAADALFPATASPRPWRRLIAPAVLLAGWLALRAAILAREAYVPPDVENPLVTASVLARVLTACQVQLLYLRDHALPLWMSTDWSFDQIPLVRSAADPSVVGFAAVLAGAVVLAIACRRARPAATFAVLGYAIAFAPASNFLFPIGTILADRLAYVPSIFACLLLAVLLVEIDRRARAVAAVAAVGAIVALGFLAVRSNRLWKDELTLYHDQVRTAPRSAKAHAGLGVALLNAGQLHESIGEFRESIRIHSRRPQPYLGMAQALDRLGADPELSIQAWSDALRHVPVGRTRALSRARRLVDLGRWSELRDLCRQTAAADPRDLFLPSLERILLAAERLARTPATEGAIERGARQLTQGNPGGAVVEIARAIHRGDVPADRLSEALTIQAAAYVRIGDEKRSRELLEAAAEVAMQ